MPPCALVTPIGDAIEDPEDRDNEEDARECDEAANHRSTSSSAHDHRPHHQTEPKHGSSHRDKRRERAVANELTKDHTGGRKIREITDGVRNEGAVIA